MPNAQAILSRQERGSALLLTFVLSAALFTLSGALMMVALWGGDAADTVVDDMHALNNAGTGISMAIAELNAEADLDGDGTNGSATEDFKVGTFTQGGYTVTVQDLGNDTYRLESTGTFTGLGQTYSRTVEVLIQPPEPYTFKYAAFGGQAVDAGGSTATDSFDSSVGPYDPATANSNGDVGSNGTITIGGTVNGDAILGPDGILIGAENVTGDTQVLGASVPMPELDSAAAAAQNDNASLSEGYDPETGAFQLSGGNRVVEFAAGTYYFTSFQITGNAGINVTGEVIIYIVGPTLVAGTSNTTGDPRNMVFAIDFENTRFYGDNQATDFVKFMGSSEFNGVVYAPKSYVQVGGSAEYKGALAAKEMFINGTGDFHFDESVQDFEFGGGDFYVVKYWKEK
ncbi:hypothetical protein IH970_02175 [candidate division KSB1 bacterium]|nr:hypothetical protein [candidate division KSB1 bacterium]